MTDKEALECVKREIIKYKSELKESILDEVLCSGVIYGSSLSSAFIYSLLNNVKNYESVPYWIAILVASLISLKNHDRYSRTLEEKNNLKYLKKLKRIIIMGNNPFENIEKQDFDKELIKKIQKY